MKKSLKIILSTLASVVSLGIVTLVIVPFAVDVNDFKAQIEAAVQNNTGRVLSIEGNVEMSVFPWLGISTEKMTLSNAEGFSAQPFAQVAEGQIKVKLWPLLFKQVEISEIVLKDLNLNLIKNPQGLGNWEDLAALIQDKQDSEKNPLKLLEIAGVLIKNAQIVWDDQQTGKKINIHDFNLSTDKLVFNHPIELVFGFSAKDSQLALTETIDFVGDLTITEELDLFSLNKIKLQTQTEGKAIPTGKLLATIAGDANFDLKQHRLKFAPLQITTGGLTISTPALTSKLQSPFQIDASIHIPNFDVAQFIRQHTQFQLPVMADEKALSWLAADFHLNADLNHLNLQNIELLLDETTVRGSTRIHNFTNPAINFNLALDMINVDRYLPPADTENNIQDLNASASAAAEKATLFPIETLKKLNINGQLTISDLKLNNLTMQGIRLLFNAKDGLVQSLQSVNSLYQGAYNGKAVFDVSRPQPILTLQQQLTDIQIEPLLTDLNGQSRFAGLIDLNTKLEASGNTLLALKSSLTGRLSFLGKDMRIRGFSLQKLLENGKILLNTPSLSSDNRKARTTFSKITGTAIINNGFLNNNDLSASTVRTKVAGMGVINLVSQQLDYKIIALLLKEKVNSAQTKIMDNFPVFINMGGTFAEPTYQVDLAAMGIGL